jgi:RND family efflux transporter MFP subunit
MRRLLIIIAPIAATLIIGCAEESGQVSERSLIPVTVQVMAVKLDQVPVTITAVGTTEPFASATPGTRLMGRIAATRFEEGDRVVSDQILVEIEDRDLTAKKRQASSAVAQASAGFENAAASVERTRNLYKQDAVPKQRLDTVEMAYRQAEAALSAAQGALQEVEANLRYSSIGSPLEGLIVRKYVQVGDMASPGAPLFTVEQQHPMKVTVDVSEQDLRHITVNQKVPVEIEAADQGFSEERDGIVEAIVPSADPNSRTFQVKLLVDNEQSRIRSGMFARVRFVKGKRPGIVIPIKAVVREGQLKGVFVVRDGSAWLRWVRLGKIVGDRVEVLSGLKQADTIIVDSGPGVTDGAPVEVRQDG